MQRPDGVTAVALYEFASGVFKMAWAYFCFIVAALVGTFSENPAWGVFIWGGLGVVLLALSLLSLIVGFGLLRMHRWSRWAALILAALGLLSVPIGTVAGILIIWYMLQDEVEAEFKT